MAGGTSLSMLSNLAFRLHALPWGGRGSSLCGAVRCCHRAFVLAPGAVLWPGRLTACCLQPDTDAERIAHPKPLAQPSCRVCPLHLPISRLRGTNPSPPSRFDPWPRPSPPFRGCRWPHCPIVGRLGSCLQSPRWAAYRSKNSAPSPTLPTTWLAAIGTCSIGLGTTPLAGKMGLRLAFLRAPCHHVAPPIRVLGSACCFLRASALGSCCFHIWAAALPSACSPCCGGPGGIILNDGSLRSSPTGRAGGTCPVQCGRRWLAGRVSHPGASGR